VGEAGSLAAVGQARVLAWWKALEFWDKVETRTRPRAPGLEPAGCSVLWLWRASLAAPLQLPRRWPAAAADLASFPFLSRCSSPTRQIPRHFKAPSVSRTTSHLAP